MEGVAVEAVADPRQVVMLLGLFLLWRGEEVAQMSDWTVHDPTLVLDPHISTPPLNSTKGEGRRWGEEL
jgi:hypothetical protein